MKPLARFALTAAVALAAAVLVITRLNAFLDKAAAARLHIAELRAGMAATQEAVRQRARIAAEVEEARQALRKLDAGLVAPDGDPFTWARSELRTCATRAGVELTVLAEAAMKPPAGLAGPAGPWFVPFRIDVEMKGTERDALRFAQLIEESNPLAQFQQFSVVAHYADQPPVIMATIEWPMWSDRVKVAQFNAWRDAAAP